MTSSLAPWAKREAGIFQAMSVPGSIVAALLGLVLLLIAPVAARAQEPAPTGQLASSPEKVRALLSLMDDPEVRAWLAGQQAAARPAEAAPAAMPVADMTAPVLIVRQHILASLGALPTAASELRQAGALLYREMATQGGWQAALPILVFVGLGLACVRAYWRMTAGFRQQLIAMQLDTVEARLGAVGRRLAFGVGWVASFALGSLGSFLMFDWTPLLHDLIARVLVVLVVVWLTRVLLRFILAPGAERFRILPMSTASAKHWSFWLSLIVGWYSASRMTVWYLEDLGISAAESSLFADMFSLLWLAILLLAVWRRPAARAADNPLPAELAAARLRNWMISLGLVLVWLLVPLGAYRLFATALVAIALPSMLLVTHRCVAHVLRPAGADSAESVPPLAGVLLERGLRALWIVGAALLLLWIWEVNVNSMTGDAAFARLLRGAMHAIVILLVIELLWHVMRTWIDRRLAEAAIESGGTPEAIHRRARVRTLLPIARNVLLAVLAVMAVLMTLSALGIEVGPLIAGAGVVGVAIGFGSQTLVKDVISGVFFLLDDAFRVGEYIESGSTRGTVEGFSLRSIKLRHHRGYLHTVPFGSLEKITNYSRDWVIDKATIGVTYDTDIDKVKRIIKQIGSELAADPELAPHIIETLKMQGIEEYGDYAIKIRLKLTSKPGEQFVIRRRAYAMIKQAFEVNGIKFAFPTVQVAGGEAAPAAAQAVLSAVDKPAA
jgi:moderate conductance mechanosensitive channel